MPDWSPDVAELVDWFRNVSDLVPHESFELAPGETVPADLVGVFLGNLHREIALGPDGSAARCGRLQRHLGRLRELGSLFGGSGHAGTLPRAGGRTNA